MVVVEFDYNEFRTIFGIDKEKLMAGLTEIGAPTEIDPETGKLFVEVTPNRPDWYSVAGLARATRAYYKKEVKKYEVEKGNWKITVDKKVSGIRPYTVGAVIKGLRLNDMMIRDVVLLQEKLLATLGRRVKRFGIGLYPFDKLKFPVKYTAMKPEEIIYRPLGYPKAAGAREILREHPKGTEYGHIIKDAKEFPVYLDADGKVMALIPIVNSEETGKVDDSTKDIFIEVSGNDVVGINQALNVLVCHFIDLGGRAYSVEVDYGGKKIRSPDLGYKKVKISDDEVERLLGTKIKKNEIKEALRRMGYFIEGEGAFIQPYRADIIAPVDIIEDIAIVYGYNNFQPTTPNFFYPGKKSNRYTELGSIMKRMGFVEISTPVLTDKETLSIFDQRGIDVLNPKTKEYTTIRPSLVPSVVEVLSKNKMKGLPQKLYEIGIAHGNEEKTSLCFVVVDKDLEFAAARGFLQRLCTEAGWRLSLRKTNIGFLEQPYAADVVFGNKVMGVFGKLNGAATAAFDLEFPVYVCSIDLGS